MVTVVLNADLISMLRTQLVLLVISIMIGALNVQNRSVRNVIVLNFLFSITVATTVL